MKRISVVLAASVAVMACDGMDQSEAGRESLPGPVAEHRVETPTPPPALRVRPERVVNGQNPGWEKAPPVVRIRPELVAGERLHAGDTAAIVLAHWEESQQGDIQRVDMVAPNGRVYESFKTPVGPLGDAEVRLALRGSHIEQFGLTGTWTARFYVNGGTAPVMEKQFEVSP